MIKKPNFFIIGAPKCGTTSLAEYLRSHPDVFFCEPKEPDHFCKDLKNCDSLTDDEYVHKYFKNVSSQVAIGEGSTHYLYSQDAVGNILKFNPEAKFIIMLRNPVEMAESLFYEEKSQLVETAQSFSEAWKKQSVSYADICKTGLQLERFFNTVPDRTRTLIINFHEFIKFPKENYLKTLEFLKLPDDGRIAFENAHPRLVARYRAIDKVLRGINNPALKPLSRKIKKILKINHWPLLGTLVIFLKKLNLQKAPKDEMDYNLKIQLMGHFQDDVNLVYKLTGINLYETTK